MTTNRKTGRLVAAVVGVLVLLVAAIGYLVLRGLTQGNPEWPSLQAAPDPSLHGTFAYFDDESMCVRLISASGATTREVMCVEPINDPAKKTKNVGIHMHWLADNRLELTMWNMIIESSKSEPTFKPAWQKIYDPATGEVVNTPLAEIPATPTPNPKPQTDPVLGTLQTTSDMGHVVVKLTAPDGVARTLIDVQGYPENYGMKEAFFGPDGSYVVSEDYQVLITTLGSTPVTRRLTDQTTTFYGYDQIDWFAATVADLL